MQTDNESETPQTALIKEHLRRSFEDKASEELPSDLMNLIEKLREQDDKSGK
ncbi:MAG: NepR family anti-sigma factor [Sulfitobacter sp.]